MKASTPKPRPAAITRVTQHGQILNEISYLRHQVETLTRLVDALTRICKSTQKAVKKIMHLNQSQLKQLLQIVLQAQNAEATAEAGEATAQQATAALSADVEMDPDTQALYEQIVANAQATNPPPASAKRRSK